MTSSSDLLDVVGAFDDAIGLPYKIGGYQYASNSSNAINLNLTPRAT